MERVSAVIPNYNYGNYLVSRLDSVITQSHPIFEIILLDDASTDDSMGILYDWMDRQNVEIRVLRSEMNSGSVFAQWKKGIEEASGVYVWIAEADDLCDTDFLETVLAPMRSDPSVVLSYCESRQIDGSGNVLASSYDHYMKAVLDEIFEKDRVVDGVEEIKTILAVVNSIPNVSGILFRRRELADVLKIHSDEIGTFKMAADYALYVRLLEKGKLAYSRKNANIHRRHRESVIARRNGRELFEEIVRVQEWVVGRFPLERSTLLKIENHRRLLKEYLMLDS